MLELLVVDGVVARALGHQQCHGNDGVLGVGLGAWLFLAGGLNVPVEFHLHYPAKLIVISNKRKNRTSRRARLMVVLEEAEEDKAD